MKGYQRVRVQFIDRNVGLIWQDSIQIDQAQHGEFGTGFPTRFQRDTVKHIGQIVDVDHGRCASRTQITKFAAHHELVGQVPAAARGYLVGAIILYQPLPALGTVIGRSSRFVEKHLTFYGFVNFLTHFFTQLVDDWQSLS